MIEFRDTSPLGMGREGWYWFETSLEDSILAAAAIARLGSASVRRDDELIFLVSRLYAIEERDADKAWELFRSDTTSLAAAA